MIAKRNQNVSNYARVFKDKPKLLIVSKKIDNGPEQKHLNLIFLVLIENVLFRSRILFQKRIYSIFFGTKAGKRKLSILKERWFDIASSVTVRKHTLSNDRTPVEHSRPQYVRTIHSMQESRKKLPSLILYKGVTVLLPGWFFFVVNWIVHAKVPHFQ
jgi:hypothetical protein